MKQTVDIPEAAFMLLVQICRTDIQTLTTAFDNLDHYHTYQKAKRSGGFRTISEPHETVKFIQRNLLFWLYRLQARRDYYYNSAHRWSVRNHRVERLFYKDIFKHLIDPRIHGARPNHSVKTASEVHVEDSNNFEFLLKIDLRDAFPSVTEAALSNVLKTILLTECKAYFFTYRKRRMDANKSAIIELIKTLGDLPTFPHHSYSTYEDVALYNPELRKVIDRIILERKAWVESAKKLLEENTFGGILTDNELYQFDTYDDESLQLAVNKNSYHRYPLFSNKNCLAFRALIRHAAVTCTTFEESIIPHIIDVLVLNIAKLVCWNGRLPQGAPTSGFLLNLVISEKKLLDDIHSTSGLYQKPNKGRGGKVSIYVDDILISTRKKPTVETVHGVVESIRKSGIFEPNPKKIKLYDLRNQSAPVLGMKFAKNFELLKYTKQDFRHNAHFLPRGLQRKALAKKPWTHTKLTLSQKKQKQYRAFLHYCTTKNVSEEEKNRAMGYLGHIFSVYTNKHDHASFPSSLKKIISRFCIKYNFKSIPT